MLAVTVANLRTQKNYPGLLAAGAGHARRVAPACGSRPRGRGRWRPRCGRNTRRWGSAIGSRLLGYRDDATRLIGGADVFVLASHHEGLPVSVMEALVLGVPVIAPAVGGLREAVTDGESGVLVRSRRPGRARRRDRTGRDRRRRSAPSSRPGPHATASASRRPAAVARVEEIYRTVDRGRRGNP